MTEADVILAKIREGYLTAGRRVQVSETESKNKWIWNEFRQKFSCVRERHGGQQEQKNTQVTC